MARLPFDPDKMPRRDPKPSKPAHLGDQPISVSQLAELIKGVLVDGFANKVRVVGEVSNFSPRGHWYFSLKDQRAAIKCVCFASSARNIRFPMKDGMQVVATGRVDYYETGGQLQLYVDAIDTIGLGTLELKFRALCEELRGLGYFEESRKRPLPMVPMKIAVVTSKTGAALQDVLKTAAQRWPGCEICLMDTLVQGASAAPKIAAVINVLSEQGPSLGIEAILLTRGGGSLEDLWAFNERVVADAVFNCSLPIVAAIGHETDSTIAELVADKRCSTPTQAVMALIPDREALDQQVRQIDQRMAMLLRREIGRAKERLTALAGRPVMARPQTMLTPWIQRLDAAVRRPVLRRPEEILERARQRLETLSRHPVFKRAEAMLEPATARLDRIRKHPAFRKPEAMYAASEARVEAATAKLKIAMDARLAKERDRFKGIERQLQMVGPGNVLQRGYSYTLTDDGKVVRSAQQVEPGTRITTVLSDGRLVSKVVGERVSPEFGRDAEEIAKPTNRKPKKKKGDEGPGLFL